MTESPEMEDQHFFDRCLLEFNQKLTGIPQFVDMPAPVTTMAFFADATMLAICCNCLSFFSTWIIDMTKVNDES